MRCKGLSPLTRGNLADVARPLGGQGPIPAHAGQPYAARRGCDLPRAYPRSLGATSAWTTREVAGQGLSPLTRGNRRDVGDQPVEEGPIPAHAGQPRRDPVRRHRARAYPRSRGATATFQALGGPDWGLSPLTRGNLRGRLGRCCVWGPIPAHAGQPCEHLADAVLGRAYPRSRGATEVLTKMPQSVEGLSPLTRGNQGRARRLQWRGGPIPAHAGQPGKPAPGAHPPRAYPRSRGATCPVVCFHSRNEGLSPLTRGNRGLHPLGCRGVGPIPAHAGQPAVAGRDDPHRRAYPRSRGATAGLGPRRPGRRGLSPLTRGNRDLSSPRRVRLGPIPAHAGQPRRERRPCRQRRAYPRSRGATARA